MSQLPPAVQARLASTLGADFSQVRAHTGSGTASPGAVAYTRGVNLHMSASAYNPMASGAYGPQGNYGHNPPNLRGGYGRSSVGHELTHVTQMRGPAR